MCTFPKWTEQKRRSNSVCRPSLGPEAQRHDDHDTKEHLVAIPFKQAARIGAYVMGQHLRGHKRYPLVLMLEPLFRCNLACAGCGKIDYPDEILNQRLSVEE